MPECLRLELIANVHDNLVHHRFVVSQIYGVADIATVNEIYSSKSSKARKAFRAKNWDLYIALHEKPYRPSALARCVRAGLRAEAYWRCVATVWIGTENYFQHKRLWRAIWTAEQPGRQASMNSKEQRILDCLSDEAIVWRGTAHPRTRNALAWTLSEKVARRFARRSLGPSFIICGAVKKGDVLALFLRRREHELVCRDVRIVSMKEVSD
jgi:hypothetical protein